MVKEVYNENIASGLLRNRRLGILLDAGIKHPKAGQFGRTVLPVSNLTPSGLAIESELLPHTQLRTQNFISIDAHKVQPTTVPAVIMVPIEKTEVIVPVLRLASLDDDALVTVLMAFTMPFYKESVVTHETSNHEIYRAWLTLYGSIDRSFDETNANTGADQGDVRFKLKPCSTIVEFIDSYSQVDPVFSLHMNYMETKNLAHKESLLVLMCVICQTIGKQVYQDNYKVWFTNRVKAASGTLGGARETQLESAAPDINAMRRNHSALGAVFYFRRMLVDRMFAYRVSQNKQGKMFNLVLQMIASTDLTHVYNIDLYIVKLIPEIMNIHLLRNYDDQLVDMYKFWIQHEAIFPYVRFYVEPEKCNAINRNILMPLIVASHTVAKYMSDSFKNYKGSTLNSLMFKNIHAAVSEYLQRRTDAIVLTMASSDRANMTEPERTYVLTAEANKSAADANLTLARSLNSMGQIVP